MPDPLPPNTPAARKRLAALLEDLVSVERPALAAAAVANQTGDAADLAGALDAQVELARLDDRIRGLQTQLNTRAVRRKTDGSVQVGSTVTVDFGDGPEKLVVGGAADLAAGVDVVTPNSPLGRAILGAEAGAQLTYVGPSGPVVPVKVVAVE